MDSIELVRRIERLEVQNRDLRRIVTAVGAVALLVLACAARDVDASFDTVTARRIEVVGDEGSGRIVLDASKKNPRFTLQDDGDNAAAIELRSSGGSWEINCGSDKTGASMKLSGSSHQLDDGSRFENVSLKLRTSTRGIAMSVDPVLQQLYFNRTEVVDPTDSTKNRYPRAVTISTDTRNDGFAGNSGRLELCSDEGTKTVLLYGGNAEHGAAITVRDKQEKDRAVLGSAALRSAVTETEYRRQESSLVLLRNLA